MFLSIFIIYLIWAIPAWLGACEELDAVNEARHYGYDYY